MHRRAWITLWAAGALPALAQNNAAQLAPIVLVVGDSLSAEYGLARGAGWVALLQERMAAQAKDWSVVNASISGDTTSGGRSRLPALLREHRPAVVVIELGGNDALRGLPLASTKSNVLAMVQAAQKTGARVLLLGMQIPPNYGKRYSEDFADIFEQVAKAQKTALLPFFLTGVADAPNAASLFQSDRIHPTAQAQPQMVDNVWPLLAPLLSRSIRR